MIRRGINATKFVALNIVSQVNNREFAFLKKSKVYLLAPKGALSALNLIGDHVEVSDRFIAHACKKVGSFLLDCLHDPHKMPRIEYLYMLRTLNMFSSGALGKRILGELKFKDHANKWWSAEEATTMIFLASHSDELIIAVIDKLNVKDALDKQLPNGIVPSSYILYRYEKSFASHLLRSDAKYNASTIALAARIRDSSSSTENASSNFGKNRSSAFALVIPLAAAFFTPKNELADEPSVSKSTLTSKLGRRASGV